MSDEPHFLTKIEAHPEDRTVRLVYADWLEDRGDRRAELIRVEEEMRRVPIYADRYWELKPCRNELRRQCEPQWLERLKYGTDYEPMFREVPGGWKERWRLIRELTEQWYGILMPDVGGHADEIEVLEKQLNQELPPSLREWGAYLLDLRGEVKARPGQKFLLAFLGGDAGVHLLLGRGSISVMHDTGSGSVFGVKMENLSNIDPPVEVYQPDEPNGRCDRVRTLDQAFTEFVFLNLIQQLAETRQGLTGWRKPRWHYVYIPAEPTLFEILPELFPFRSNFGRVSIWEATNSVVLFWPDILSPTMDRLNFSIHARNERVKCELKMHFSGRML